MFELTSGEKPIAKSKILFICSDEFEFLFSIFLMHIVSGLEPGPSGSELKPLIAR